MWQHLYVSTTNTRYSLSTSMTSRVNPVYVESLTLPIITDVQVTIEIAMGFERISFLWWTTFQFCPSTIWYITTTHIYISLVNFTMNRTYPPISPLFQTVIRFNIRLNPIRSNRIHCQLNPILHHSSTNPVPLLYNKQLQTSEKCHTHSLLCHTPVDLSRAWKRSAANAFSPTSFFATRFL